MKGKIIKWLHKMGYGFIQGDDGREYFLHEDDANTKKLRKGNIVSFDVLATPEQGRDRAVRVQKVGHGINHPFIGDLDRIAETLKKNVTDETELNYKLQDIEVLKGYFARVCDVDSFHEIRKEVVAELKGNDLEVIE